MKEQQVTLRHVTRDNWEAVNELGLHPHQSMFVPTVAESVAKVYLRPDGDHVSYEPFAIYDGEEIVGFLMIAYEVEDETAVWMNGFFIDKERQGHGYGRAAVQAAISLVKERFPNASEMRLTLNSSNSVAESLYRSLGFEDTGVVYGDEHVNRLIL